MALPGDPEQYLRQLEGQALGLYRTALRRVERLPTREKESRFFELDLRVGTVRSTEPVVTGLFSTGRASLNVASYLDISFQPRIRLSDQTEHDLAHERVDRPLFQLLGTLVEPGGKMIVAVTDLDAPASHAQTFAALDRGAPPGETYVGQLLQAAGCGSAFKLWLIREGGREGPMALQGEKALRPE